MSRALIDLNQGHVSLREFSDSPSNKPMLVVMIDGDPWYDFNALPAVMKGAYAGALSITGQGNRLIRHEDKIYRVTPSATASLMAAITYAAAEGMCRWQHQVAMPWIRKTRRRHRAAICRAVRRAA